MKSHRLTTLALSLSTLFGSATLAQANPAVLNIAAPNAAGISHNYYRQLNINESGLVLNNSTTAGTSQLAGALGANPKFRGHAADTILMEVRVPGQASRLGGPLEAFGKRPDLIIANPNGITVNGMSTINVRSLTLMDANTPNRHNLDFQFKQDAKGVIIEGNGLNASGLDFFDLLASRIQINGPIMGSADTDINLRSGVKSYRYSKRSDKDLPHEALTRSSSDLEQIRISGTAAGAMYGGYITIQVGGGSIDLQNSVTSAESILIDAYGRVSVKALDAEKLVSVRGSNVTLNGNVDAKQSDIYVHAYSNGGKLDVQRSVLTANGGDINLRAHDVTLSGALRAENGETLIKAHSLSMLAGVHKGQSFKADVNNARFLNGSIETNSADLAAKESITLGSRFSTSVKNALHMQAGSVLDNESRRIRAGNIDIEAEHVENNGLLESRRGKVNVTSYSLDNQRSGEIKGAAGVNIGYRHSDENAAIINMGKILSGRETRSGSDAIFIKTKGVFINAPRGEVKTEVGRGGNVNIQAKEGLDLESGSKIFGDHITITATRVRTDEGEARTPTIVYNAEEGYYNVGGTLYTKTRSRDGKEYFMSGGYLYSEERMLSNAAKKQVDLSAYLGSRYGTGFASYSYASDIYDLHTDPESLKTAFGK